MNTSLITALNVRTGTLAPTIREARSGEGPRREQLPVSPQPVEKKREGQDRSLVVKGPGSAVESGVVRYTVNVGPYDVNVSTMAMRRYAEASSHRAWCPGTFEATA